MQVVNLWVLKGIYSQVNCTYTITQSSIVEKKQAGRFITILDMWKVLGYSGCWDYTVAFNISMVRKKFSSIHTHIRLHTHWQQFSIAGITISVTLTANTNYWSITSFLLLLLLSPSSRFQNFSSLQASECGFEAFANSIGCLVVWVMASGEQVGQCGV